MAHSESDQEWSTSPDYFPLRESYGAYRKRQKKLGTPPSRLYVPVEGWRDPEEQQGTQGGDEGRSRQKLYMYDAGGYVPRSLKASLVGGEFVVRADMVRRNRRLLERINTGSK